MRAITLGILMTGAVVAGSTTAYAQDALPPPAANTGDTSGSPGGSPPAAAQPTQPTEALPPPQAGGPSGADASNLTGTPAPSAVGTAPNPDEWRFSWHGYFRAPLRIGVGSRPKCPRGTTTPTAINANSTEYCAAPGQSLTNLHSPYIPDDQYLSWTFDRQWEQAWAEVFLSYGNNHVVGTVGIQGYDFTDVSLLGNSANPAQFGIGQGWLTINPDLPVDGLRMNWKVGAFWEKFGMAGKYDGGPYDTYMFGRTHTMGESLGFEYDVGDFTLRARHGFGAHLEMMPAGVTLNGGSSAQASISNTANTLPPLGASPGFTLLDHAHIGVSYKKLLDFNAHYMVSWEQDDRVEGTGAAGGYLPGPSGSLSVYGAEARFLGGVFGELYAGYSHIDAKNVTTVGPAIEVLHSNGGGGHNGGNGIYENYFNGVGNGTGKIDSVQLGYNFSFGYLWRKLQNPHASFWGDGVDVRLALFMMYSAVSGTDATSVNPFNMTATDGTKKLKYGADLVASLLPWMGIGVRGDYIQPDSHDVHESFGVISPKVMFHTRFITHEEITAQYSHYWNGHDVLPQQFIAYTGTKNIGQSFAVPYPNDSDVFGIKATMWW